MILTLLDIALFPVLRWREACNKSKAARTTALLCCVAALAALSVQAQSSTADTTEQKIERLSAAVARAQAQMETYQKQMIEMRQQLLDLQNELAAQKQSPAQSPADVTAASTPKSALDAAAVDEIQERQAIAESQIATHEETKVETKSKYPLALTGLILFNGFINTHQVDVSAAPSYAIQGPGSTGLSMRQTMLGLEARGPHLFGATSSGDIHADFFANDAQSTYASSGLLRLRTAHALLDWKNTEAFFEVDRPILEPNEPSSLVAIAQPELAWAGNLWSWNPQAGVSQRLPITDSTSLRLQAALIDTADVGLPGSTSTSTVTQTERSRWPGSEARVSLQQGKIGVGPELGLGGYYSPHHTASGYRYDAWAATADLRLPVSRYLTATVNAYRGQALAGLGGGGYVNYVYRYRGAAEVASALSDVGGWAQLKIRAGSKLDFNSGYGIDNPFASEIRYATGSARESVTESSYQGLTKNRSVFSNVIYSPSAYLLFSLEYRRIWSGYLTSPTAVSDSIGIGAGYKF